MDKIDGILYINLKHRIDRNQHQIEQFNRLGITNFERLDAIKFSPGEYGCAMSHIACLGRAIEKGWKNVLIIEDDMTWEIDRVELDRRLNNFFNVVKEWDVVLFTCLAYKQEFVSDGICRVKHATTTTCYLVNGHYMNTLKKNYESVLSQPVVNGLAPSIDSEWNKVMGKDKFYSLVPNMGYQKPDISDIRGYCNTQGHFHRPFSVFLQGGLGNRLFQVAFGYALAKKQGHVFHLGNQLKNPHSTQRYFDWIPKMNKFPNKVVMEKMEEYSSYVYADPVFESDFVYEFRGFFQNEKYFLPYKEEVVHLLTPKVNEELLKRKYPLLEKSYFLHVRRGDFLQGNDYNLGLDSYYEKCLSLIGKANLYIFSDDPLYVLKAYPRMSPNTGTIIVENELDSLWLMSKCKLGGICSNSTFSWWGSYLNTNPNKKVYFPNKWLNKNWPCDIWPEYAIKVEI